MFKHCPSLAWFKSSPIDAPDGELQYRRVEQCFFWMILLLRLCCNHCWEGLHPQNPHSPLCNSLKRLILFTFINIFSLLIEVLVICSQLSCTVCFCELQVVRSTLQVFLAVRSWQWHERSYTGFRKWLAPKSPEATRFIQRLSPSCVRDSYWECAISCHGQCLSVTLESFLCPFLTELLSHASKPQRMSCATTNRSCGRVAAV